MTEGPAGAAACPALVNVLRCLALAALIAAGPALTTSHDSGRKNRQSRGARRGIGDRVDTHPDLTVADLAQGAGVPPRDPGEPVPSFGKPVSSIAHATGATTSTARWASRDRTAMVSQVEVVTNCCNP